MIAFIAAFVASSNDGVAWPLLLIGAVVGVPVSLGSSWQFFVQWLNGVRGRNWPTVPAIIDLVSVQERVEPGGKGPPIVTYVALLTYVYHNPDLQTGDYDKSFGDKDEAQDWANSYKGCTVMVHVDPRDPARSVLRKEDLEAAVTQTSVPGR